MMPVRQDRSHGLTAEGLHGGSVALAEVANAANSRAATVTPELRGIPGFLSLTGRSYRALKGSVNARKGPTRPSARGPGGPPHWGSATLRERGIPCKVK